MKTVAAKKIGIWFLAFSLFAFHLLCRSVAHAESPPILKGTDSYAWQPVSAKNGQWKISFPVPPQMVQQTVPLNGGTSQLSYDIYLAPNEEKGMFMLLIATYPAALTAGQEVAGLEGLLNGIVNHHPDNELVFAELVKYMGYPAMDFLVKSATSYFRGHAFMVGNQLFLIAMEGDEAGMSEATYSRFFQSFQLKK